LSLPLLWGRDPEVRRRKWWNLTSYAGERREKLYRRWGKRRKSSPSYIFIVSGRSSFSLKKGGGGKDYGFLSFRRRMMSIHYLR